MKPITITDITKYIEKHIPEFHQKRLTSLSGLKLKKVLARKNPYLFRAKNMLAANDLVKSLLDAHLSSQEETVFGSFLEGLAIYICHHVFGGNKSSAEGIDLEFRRDGIQYIVTIKSGPNWGNSSQIGKMKLNFSKAKRILNTNRSTTNIVAVNGCCYGKNAVEDQDGYVKKCGQSFWSFISGNDGLYTQIIEPMGHRAKERNEEFIANYAKVLNRFTVEFANDFCTKDFAVDWAKLVKFNSSL
jgi:hypothetical protein